MNDTAVLVARLEQYTLKYPQEVLLVSAQIADEADQIIIFKGFSSSLMQPTAYDPEVPTLPDSAIIHHIDRLQGPYQPLSPKYLEQNIPLATFLAKLATLGL